MGEVMGVGMFHGPQPALSDETMANIYFRRNLTYKGTPELLRNPANWRPAGGMG